MSIKVLIVEDDVDLGNLLKQYLELNNFTASRVFNGIEARLELQRSSYDILIVDVMMPSEDGFSLAEKLTAFYPGLPFLFVTARKAKEDVMKGLRLGADDYIVKPFDADELVQRVRNILKRVQSKIAEPEEMLQIGIYTFDVKNLTLKSAQTQRILTEKEASLLHYLCTHPNRLIKRNDILNHLWQSSDFFVGRSMDVFISRLRKYLSKDPSIEIESIRGVGFLFKISA
ncbi:response regulator transcription factor [Mucilaginibacter sp. 21P]|uniref:response regulator transcription factor n=1 Tax=Mucilaginibacter sp. 21P TaxID=2778902 RepID=UPI001C58B2EE|nr:response regulator transcription factor [Mucilaginibacter sp. 21P]QXV63972.1 response regulator transcription factor [Mucilaginibacter sp. 21P]